MSIGRANEHQRVPEAQPSGRAVSGARTTCAGRARARMSISRALRVSAGHQLAGIERQRECKKSGSEMKAVSEKLSLLSLLVVL